MRSFVNSILMILLAGVFAAGQTATAKSTVKPASSAPASNLPSEATVDSFLQQTFGYEHDLSWKISSIKPAPVPGLAEVVVVIASPQGQQLSRFFVTADGEHAVVGDIIPFGAKPFGAAKTALEKGISGPERGPKDAPVTIVEFGDLQCPACKAAQPAIEGLVAAEPNARFVFQNFPLEMHNWAAKGAAYADCANLALPASDVRRLVGLCMWAQRDPGCARGSLHALDVGIERSRLDDEGRRFDVAQHGIVWIKRGQHEGTLSEDGRGGQNARLYARLGRSSLYLSQFRNNTTMGAPA